MVDGAGAVVITTAQVKDGHIDAVAGLFMRTNPRLVAEEADWLAAQLASNRESGTVTVIAWWRRAASYEVFRQGEAFQAVMGQFGPHLSAPPVVSVSTLVMKMDGETVSWISAAP